MAGRTGRGSGIAARIDALAIDDDVAGVERFRSIAVRLDELLRTTRQ